MPSEKPPDFFIDAKPLELTEKEQKVAAEVARNVDDADYYDAAPFSQVLAESKAKKSDVDPLAELRPKLKAIERAALADMRREEAGRVLSWLNANGCLHFGALTKALAAIENGDHRR